MAEAVEFTSFEQMVEGAEDPNELVVALGKEITDLKYQLQREKAEHQLAKKALGDQDEPLYEEIGRLESELVKVEKELVGVKSDCRTTVEANETEKKTAILELTENLENSESRKKTALAESRKNKKELDDLKENHAQVVKERDDLAALVEKMKYHQRELVMRPSADADKLRKADLRIEELELELSEVRTREMDGKQTLAQSQEKVQSLEKELRLGGERYEETLKAKQELEHKQEQLM